ncbi:SDR family oxidoreductase [Thermomonospora umbrina]|uniref:NADP-dependent 3-hydroxy acid dehydrogenase YdfG n=1 Tax=Thermomonospora umbrina TaxID=111806 RepID=A0A3D9SS56_9ACTN|nr:SDR family oxidoreductase [Thermomonospora umbrina]REE98796.1 NADP-dependent 3-hydroxy acid dehydrogenase YdfG [Thermomonospora umbrina]
MTSTALETATAAQPLTGRIAVVTGASSGIGAATARALSARGARVALLARRADRLDGLVAELGDRALAVPTDVADPDAIGRAAARIADELGRVDLVVNNAGVMLAAPFEDRRTDDWHRMIDINVTGAIRVADAFLADLIATAAEGRPADLIDISSVAAHGTFPSFAVYCATKAALTHFSRNLRAELAPRRVRVTNIEPGLVATELQGHVDHPDVNAVIDDWRDTLTWLSDADLGDLIAHVAGLPWHVNLPHIVAMPTEQV